MVKIEPEIYNRPGILSEAQRAVAGVSASYACAACGGLIWQALVKRGRNILRCATCGGDVGGEYHEIPLVVTAQRRGASRFLLVILHEGGSGSSSYCAPVEPVFFAEAKACVSWFRKNEAEWTRRGNLGRASRAFVVKTPVFGTPVAVRGRSFACESASLGCVSWKETAPTGALYYRNAAYEASTFWSVAFPEKARRALLKFAHRGDHVSVYLARDKR